MGLHAGRVQASFYDLGKNNYWGPQSKGSVDFHFDESRTALPAADWETAAGRAAKAAERRAAVKEQALARHREPVLACGSPQMED